MVGNTTEGDAVSFSVHCTRGYVMSICPIIRDVNFCHLAKVVFAGFLYYRVIFPLLVISNLLGVTMRLCKYSVS